MGGAEVGGAEAWARKGGAGYSLHAPSHLHQAEAHTQGAVTEIPLYQFST